ncbi:MAG: hypothetical protein GXO88_13770 [Chlorobi bacterium]|nr:hypothetical protein [Chlorobiota bacterium]
MSNLKTKIYKGMNKVMLDCETASLFVAQKDYSKLSILNRIKLWLHLLTCKHCREFARQSRSITYYMKVLGSINENEPVHKLSDDQKKHIIEEVEKQQYTN